LGKWGAGRHVLQALSKVPVRFVELKTAM